MIKITSDAVLVKFSQYRSLEELQWLRKGLFNALRSICTLSDASEYTLDGIFHLVSLLEELEIQPEKEQGVKHKDKQELIKDLEHYFLTKEV